jgi:restriction endonuclease S subunit
MGNKVSELEALNAEKDKCIASLEDELKRAKEEYEPEIDKIRHTSGKETFELSAVQMKIGDLNDEVNRIRQLNENYRILMTKFYTLGNRCYNELILSSTGATSREKNFVDGDLEGMTQWIVSQTRAYKSVLST